MEKEKKMAMLIDADNISASQIRLIIQEVSKYGNIALKRAYGNWRKDALKSWIGALKQFGIKAVQQFDYITGKNTTDIALIIDAMCLLQRGIYDGFVIVSSDSDFTPLAIHLHEVGVFVMGVGEKKTHEAFRNGCDVFFVLPKEPASLPQIQPACCSQDKKAKPFGIEDIHTLLQKAYNKNIYGGDYTYVSTAGEVIKSVVPNFNPKSYGYSSLHGLIEAFPQKYEVKLRGTVYSYRCIAEKKPSPLLGKRTIAHRQAILNYLRVHDCAQRKELEKLLSLQASRTREILHSLILDGAIIAEGDSKNRVYKRSA